MERKIYKEIPGGKNRFHSAVFTTFSINLHHFEGQVLRLLKEKWITSVNILADQNMLNSSLGVSSNYLKSINSLYSINGINSIGAFHPKINYFIGDSCLLAVLGSGNITPGGHGKNHEVFCGFYADGADNTELPLLLELWEYINGFAKRTGGYSAERICKTVVDCCDLFANKKHEKHQFYNVDNGLVTALLYNEKGSSIYRQLSTLIPVEEIEEITIICPYYDRDGALLNNFKDLFHNSHLNVYLQKDQGLPPVEIELNERISFYDFNKTTRGRKIIAGLENNRLLHAKVFHFKSQAREYLLLGSANATIAAMGAPNCFPLNDELCVLYASSSLDFLDVLEFNKVGETIKNVNTLIRQEYYEYKSTANSRTKHLIRSIDLEGRLLKVYIDSKKELTSHCHLSAFTEDGIESFSLQVNAELQEELEFTLSAEQLDQFPQYCAFVNDNGSIVSNKQPINRINELRNTNPEKKLRNIREIIRKVETGQFNELEIADYLAQLYREDAGVRRSSMPYSCNTEDKMADKDITILSYDEAIAVSCDPSALSKVATEHITSRLWQCLEHIFENKSSAFLDELMNEEEEASATKSGKRQIEDKEYYSNAIRVGHDTKRPFNIVKKLVGKYCSNIKREQFNEKHNIGIVDYLYFLLNSHIITAVCHFCEYTSFPEKYNITAWKGKLYSLYSESIQCILNEFALLHQRLEIEKYTEEQSDLLFRHNDLLNKVLYHVLLDTTLACNKFERQEPVVKERLILYCLNIIDKCGLPNGGLIDYLEKLSTANGNTFYPQHVLKMLNEIIAVSKEGKYKKTGKLGICKIESIQGSKYQIKTIYGQGYSHVDKKDISDFVLSKVPI